MTWVLGIAGLLAYNWWILVPFRPGLMRSPDELFSNLEVSGQPFAAAMQHADILSGLLLMSAFLVAGVRSIPGARREWLGMVIFAVAGAFGGVFSQVCEDGINQSCQRMEWHFELPLSQYLHDGFGIVEFAAITVALVLACKRTWGDHGAAARASRGMAGVAIVAYPLLGVAYLGDKFGAFAEGLFFVGFTVMIVTQLAERTLSARRRTATATAHETERTADAAV